jgi:hypothetical protein
LEAFGICRSQEPRVVSVYVQSLNAEAMLIDTALRAREQDELVDRLKTLEPDLEAQQEQRGYG